MVGLVHHGARDQRWRPHPLERGDAAGALLRTVHTARVELNDTVRIWKAAVSDAVLLGIELDDVHAGDEGVEDVLPLGDLAECRFQTGLVPAVLELVAVRRGNHDRFADRSGHRGCLTERRGPRRRGEARRGAGLDEFAAIYFRGHVVALLQFTQFTVHQFTN